MRYRKAEWDVPMPSALIAYWTAWNENDLERLPALLDQAVVNEVEWNDPRDSFIGKAALEAAMRRLRTSKPEYRFTIESEMDGHNDRFRYRWNMSRMGRVLMEGLDVATLDRATGLIVRVDGFFGSPTPATSESQIPSGVPEHLRV